MKYQLNTAQVDFLKHLIDLCWKDDSGKEMRRPTITLWKWKDIHRPAIRELWLSFEGGIAPLIDTTLVHVRREGSQLMWYTQNAFAVCISKGQRKRAEKLIEEFYERQAQCD
jgi:hypothetical protein